MKLPELNGAWVKNSNLQLEQWMGQCNDRLRQQEMQINDYCQAQENRFRSMEARLEYMQVETRKWLEAALAWLDQIPVSYPNLDRFMEEFEKFQDACRETIALYEVGAIELAYVQAHQLYSGLSQFRHRLEADLVLTTSVQKKLQEKAGEFYRHVQSQQVVKAMDNEGQELPDDIDVDYWTQGDYSRFLQEIMQFYSQVSQPNLSPQQLQDPAGPALPRAGESLDRAGDPRPAGGAFIPGAFQYRSNCGRSPRNPGLSPRRCALRPARLPPLVYRHHSQ